MTLLIRAIITMMENVSDGFLREKTQLWTSLFKLRHKVPKSSSTYLPASFASSDQSLLTISRPFSSFVVFS